MGHPQISTVPATARSNAADLVLLVVHDDEQTRSALVTQLMGEGFGNIAEVGSTDEALGWLQASESPDVVVCDCDMTDADGLEFCNMVRRSGHQGARATPIILLMNSTDPLVHDVALQVGASAVAIKPAWPAEIARKICEAAGCDHSQLEAGTADTVIPADHAILVIEPNLAKRSMIVQMLRQRGFVDIKEATGSASGLSMLHIGLRPHVVICNISSHDDDWKRFCTSVRKMHIAALEKLPVILLTSEDTDELKETAIGMGRAKIIKHPVSPNQLAESIQEMAKRGPR